MRLVSRYVFPLLALAFAPWSSLSLWGCGAGTPLSSPDGSVSGPGYAGAGPFEGTWVGTNEMTIEARRPSVGTQTNRVGMTFTVVSAPRTSGADLTVRFQDNARSVGCAFNAGRSGNRASLLAGQTCVIVSDPTRPSESVTFSASTGTLVYDGASVIVDYVLEATGTVSGQPLEGTYRMHFVGAR